MAATNRKSRRRLWAIGGATLVVVALLAVLVVRTLLPSWLVRQAAARGIVLEPTAVEAHLGRIVVRDASIRLADVRGLEARVATLTIELDLLTPRRALLDGVSVDMHGGEPLQDVPRWFAAHPIGGTEGAAAPDRVAARATGVRIRWWPAEADAGPPWIELDNATIDPVAVEGALRGAIVRALGKPIGEIDLVYAWTTEALALGLAAERLDRAPLRVSVTSTPAGVALDARIEALPVATIAALAPASPPRTASLSAHAELAIPMPRESAGGVALRGTVSGEIVGWTPPHPSELDGILFGDRTRVAAAVIVDEAATGAELDDVRVTAGALALRGKGRLGLDDPSRFELHLSGTVPCSELAHSAALARLGRELGDLAGQLARGTLTGNVLVRIDASGDPRRLDQARIERAATLRCRARGL